MIFQPNENQHIPAISTTDFMVVLRALKYAPSCRIGICDFRNALTGSRIVQIGSGTPNAAQNAESSLTIGLMELYGPPGCNL
jgi:hypothetical protein